MIAFYVNRILKGRITLDNVPEKWREAVREALENDPGAPESEG